VKETQGKRKRKKMGREEDQGPECPLPHIANTQGCSKGGRRSSKRGKARRETAGWNQGTTYSGKLFKIII